MVGYVPFTIALKQYFLDNFNHYTPKDVVDAWEAYKRDPENFNWLIKEEEPPLCLIPMQ